MESRIEAIAKLAHIRVPITSHDVNVIADPILDCSAHYCTLVEGGSKADLQRLRVITKDIAKISSMISLSDSHASFDMNNVGNIKKTLEHNAKVMSAFVERTRPVSPTKELFSSVIPAGESSPLQHKTKQPSPPKNNPSDFPDDDDDDSDETDVDMEPADEEIRQKQTASRLHRMLQLGLLAILILSCVGVVMVSKSQLELAKGREIEATTTRMLAMAMDGCEYIFNNITKPASIDPQGPIAWFIKDLTPPVTMPTSEPPRLFEFHAATQIFDVVSRTVRTAIITPLRYPLLCTETMNEAYLAQNDLDKVQDVGMSRLTANCQIAVSAPGSVWKLLSRTNQVYSSSGITYRNSDASQAAQTHKGSGLAVAVTLDKAALGSPITMWGSGPRSLANRWEVRTATWISFTIAIGFLLLLFAGEVLSFLHSLTPRRATFIVIYAVVSGFVVLATVAVAARIAWMEQQAELKELRREHVSLLREVYYNAVSSKFLSPEQNIVLSSVIASSSLRGLGFISEMASLAGNVRFFPPAMSYARDTMDNFRRANLRFHMLPQGSAVSAFARKFTVSADDSLIVGVIQDQSFSDFSIDDSSKNSAGVILGSLGATCVYMIIFFFATDLRDLFHVALGELQLVRLCRPHALRQMYYAMLVTITIATVIAISFSVTSDIDTAKEAVAGIATKLSAQAALLASQIPVGDLNPQSPSSGEFLSFKWDASQGASKNSVTSMYSPKYPPQDLNGWAGSYLPARVGLSGITTTFADCPSYFLGGTDEINLPATFLTQLVSTAAMPPSVVGSSTRAAGTYQRLRNYGEFSTVDFSIHVTAITAVTLALILSIFAIEMLYRMASDADRDSSRRTMLLCATALCLLLPSFSLLIASGANLPAIAQDMNDFVVGEVTTTADSVASILETIPLPRISSFIGELNREPSPHRWALVRYSGLVPIFPLVGEFRNRSVTNGLPAAAGGDAVWESWTVPVNLTALGLNESTTAPRYWYKDTTDSGIIRTTEESGIVERRGSSYAFAERVLQLHQPETVDPTTIYSLILFVNKATAVDKIDPAMDMYVKISGTSVVCVFLMSLFLLWLTLHAASTFNLPVFDSSALFVILPTSENSKVHEPAPLPRFLRVWYIAAFVVPAVTVVFFAVSCLCFHSEVLRTATLVTRGSSEETRFLEVCNTTMFTVSAVISGLPFDHTTQMTYTFQNPQAKQIFETAFTSVSSAFVETASNFARNEQLVTLDVKDNNALLRIYYTENVVHQRIVRSSIESTSSMISSLTQSYYLNQTGTPDIDFRSLILAALSLTYYMDAVVKLQILERYTITSMIDLYGAKENSFLTPSPLVAEYLKSVIANETNRLVMDLDYYFARVAGNLSSASDSPLMKTAIDTLTKTQKDFLSLLPLLRGDNVIWVIQRQRIDLAREGYNFIPAMAAQRAAVAAFTDSVTTARIMEQRTRQIGQLAKQGAAIPHTHSEKLLLLNSYDGRLTQLLVCAFLVLFLSVGCWLAISLVSARAVLKSIEEKCFNTVVEQHDGEEDTDQLIFRAHGVHFREHRSTIVFAAVCVLAMMIPLGLGYGVSRDAIPVARQQVRQGSATLKAAACAQRIYDINIMTSTSTSLIENCTACLEAQLEAVAEELRQIKRIIDWEYTTHGEYTNLTSKSNAEVAKLIDYANFLLGEIDKIHDEEMVALSRGLFRIGRIATYMAPVEVVSLRALSQLPTIGSAALSNFSVVDGPLADALARQVAFFLNEEADVAHPDPATQIKRKLAFSLKVQKISDSIRGFSQPILAENYMVTSMVLGTSVNNSFVIDKYGDLSVLKSFINTLNASEPVAIALNKYFGTVMGNLTGAAAATLFYNTASGGSEDSTDLGDIMTLVAEWRQWSLRSPSFAEFQVLYAYNRDHPGAPKVSKHSTRRPLAWHNNQLLGAVKKIMQSPVLLPAETLPADASIVDDTFIRVDLHPVGLSGMATVRSAQQWSFIVAFWAMFLGFYHLASHLKMLE